MNTDAIETLVARWAEPDGIPYKGELISDDGCMCAQGQALHYIGGWDEDRLRNTNQREADRETAKLLGISTAHAILLRTVNDSVDGAPSVVLTDPAKVLGAQADKVLAFWRHLDRMTEAQWDAAGDAARATQGSAQGSAWAAAGATNEIQGAAIMRERGQPFFFLPMFGFASPEEIPEVQS